MKKKFRINMEEVQQLRAAINEIDSELVKSAVEKIYGGASDGDPVVDPWAKVHGDATWSKA